MTGFMIACKYGHIEIVKLLLSNDKINDININKHSALMYACKYGNIHVVKFLLEKGANISHINNQGENCLIVSRDAPNNNIDLVQFLINKGSDINQRDTRGRTAFMRECICLKYETVKILAVNKADISHRCHGGNSLLKVMFKLVSELIPRRIELKDCYMNIIKLIVSSYDDYKKYTDDVSQDDISYIEKYIKND